jgi:hypothetical protein
MVDKKLLRDFEVGPDLGLGGSVLIKPGEMGRNAGMKTRNHLVKYDLLLAYILAIITISTSLGPSEAVLLINHLPYRRSIIVCE